MASRDPIIEELRGERHRRELTLQELSELIGHKNYQTIWQWESGVDIRLSNLREWADALGYDVVLVPRQTAAEQHANQ